MTELEWAACTEPMRLIEFACEKVSARKLRLFAVACCWPLWPSMTHACSREAVLVAQRFADGLADKEGLVAGRKAIKATIRNRHRQEVLTAAWLETLDCIRAEAKASRWAGAWDAARSTLRAGAHEAAREVANAALVTLSGPNGTERRKLEDAEKGRQVTLLHDIIGDPFRHTPIRPEWLTKDAVSLARAAYDGGIVPLMPLDGELLGVLSDALEEAGCDDRAILDHLRSPEPHVRGCWAVDLLLANQ